MVQVPLTYFLIVNIAVARPLEATSEMPLVYSLLIASIAASGSLLEVHRFTPGA